MIGTPGTQLLLLMGCFIHYSSGDREPAYAAGVAKKKAAGLDDNMKLYAHGPGGEKKANRNSGVRRKKIRKSQFKCKAN